MTLTNNSTATLREMARIAMNKALYEKYVKELKLDFEKPDSLMNKIKLCSYLVCCGASVELKSYPLNNKDFRTGNTGLQLTVGNPYLRALIPFFYMEKDNPISHPAKGKGMDTSAMNKGPARVALNLKGRSEYAIPANQYASITMISR